MNSYALGMLEAVGYTTAVSAADAALKAADVELIALEKVIGAGGSISVTIHLRGDVAAVASAIEAGGKEGSRVGTIVAAHVIPHAHTEVGQKLIARFSLPASKKMAYGNKTIGTKNRTDKKYIADID